MFENIIANFKTTEFYRIFNLRDDLAKGRSCVFISSVMMTIINTLTTGIFYTGFLLINDIDIVNIGFLGSIPYLTSIFSLFTPAILSKFKRRKVILRSVRIIYYLINIGGITLIPLLNLPKNITYILFVILVFTSSTIKFSFESGFTTWESDFLPNNVRAGFFSIRQITNGTLSSITILISGIITDSVKNSGNQLNVMVSLRLFALILAIIEALIVTSPREFEQKNSEITWKSLITIPFKYKKFVTTMAFVFMWNFSSQIGLTFYDVYILDTVKISYTMISAITASNCLFIFAFTPMWKRFLYKHSWLKTFALTALMHVPTIFFGGFVNPHNYIWLYVSMRLIQHFEGVGLNLSFANMSLLNLPNKDKTSCLSFYLLVNNLGSFAGQFIGSTILAMTKDFNITLFGNTYSNVIIVTTLEALLMAVTAIIILKFGHKFDHSTME